MDDEISIVIDDVEFTGWKSFEISRTLDSFCGSFSLQLVSLPDGITDQISINSKCEIKIGSDILLVGFVYQRERSVNATSTSLRISGRDITADLVDCSAIHPSNYWTNVTLEKIASDIAKPFDIFVDARIDFEIFKEFSIQQGESAYEAIERACRQRGILPITDRFGNLVLTNIDPNSNLTQFVELVYGENIKSLAESIDYGDRYQNYFVRGQDSGSGKAWTKETLERQGTANDKTINRYRPLVIVNESKSSSSSIRKRAAWEAQIRAGRSTVYTTTVQGFRQNPKLESTRNPLWELTDLVTLVYPQWNINKAFVISEITYSYSDGGQLTTMTLKDPQTYQANPSGEVNF